jgi:hypothetical protein
LLLTSGRGSEKHVHGNGYRAIDPDDRNCYIRSTAGRPGKPDHLTVGPDLEGEFVTTDVDEVTVSEGSAGMYSPTLNHYSVGRSQVSDHESASGIDDYGMMSTDFGVIEDNVVICQAPYPCGRRLQGVTRP